MIDFTIHAVSGSGRVYTATIPRKVNYRRRNQKPFGKEYLLNWPYVRNHKTFGFIIK